MVALVPIATLKDVTVKRRGKTILGPIKSWLGKRWLYHSTWPKWRGQNHAVECSAWGGTALEWLGHLDVARSRSA